MRCAHQEIVLYIINTVIKLAPEQARCILWCEEERKGRRKSTRDWRQRRDKKEGIVIRVSRHVFIQREAVTGVLCVYLSLLSYSIHHVTGTYISTEEYI